MIERKRSPLIDLETPDLATQFGGIEPESTGLFNTHDETWGRTSCWAGVAQPENRLGRTPGRRKEKDGVSGRRLRRIRTETGRGHADSPTAGTAKKETAREDCDHSERYPRLPRQEVAPPTCWLEHRGASYCGGSRSMRESFSRTVSTFSSSLISSACWYISRARSSSPSAT